MAWRDALVAFAALMAAANAHAIEGATGCTDLRGLPINFAVDWQTDVKPIINEMFATGRCTSCHNAQASLDLTDAGIDAIYKILPAYAVPGDPKQSVLFDKVNCQQPGHGGQRMPFGQAALGIAEQGLIHDWIEQGALGDVEGEAEIPRLPVFRDGIESLRR